jgi:hypothetical protein
LELLQPFLLSQEDRLDTNISAKRRKSEKITEKLTHEPMDKTMPTARDAPWHALFHKLINSFFFSIQFG